MSDINAISGTNSVSDTSNNSIGELETLLIGDVVTNYDAQIEVFGDELEMITEQKSQLTQAKSDIMTLSDIGSGEDASVHGFTNEDDEALSGPYKEYTPDEYKKLQTAAAACGMSSTLTENTDAHTANYYVTDAVVTALEKGIDEQITELNSNSEMKMISFQALMDARKQSLMMLSNMISSDNQTKMAIIQNMKS